MKTMFFEKRLNTMHVCIIQTKKLQATSSQGTWATIQYYVQLFTIFHEILNKNNNYCITAECFALWIHNASFANDKTSVFLFANIQCQTVASISSGLNHES